MILPHSQRRLDVKEKDRFHAAVSDVSDDAGKVALKRTSDHVSWVKSDRLVDAFDTYDPLDLGSGFCLTLEFMTCSFGMFGVKENLPHLIDWVNVSNIDRKNLYLQTTVFNFDELKNHTSAAIANVREQVSNAPSLAGVSAPLIAKFIKNAADTAKKCDSAMDEWLRDRVVQKIHLKDKEIRKTGAVPEQHPIRNLSKFHLSAEGKFMALIAEWTQAVSMRPGIMDRAISGVVGVLITSRLEKITTNLTINRAMGTLPEDIRKQVEESEARAKKQSQAAIDHEQAAHHDRVRRDQHLLAAEKARNEAATIRGSIQRLLTDEQRVINENIRHFLTQISDGERPDPNNFRQSRMAVLLLNLEVLSIKVKLNATDELSTKEYTELFASACSLMSITIDIVYSVTKAIREFKEHGLSATALDAADIMRGGMKLTSGFLSALSGGINTFFDIKAARDEIAKEQANWVLFAVYATRGGSGVLTTVFGLGAALSYAEPVLKYLLPVRYSASAAPLASEAVAALVARRTLFLVRVARFNLVGLAATAIEIVYRGAIQDDALENWLQACTFRKYKHSLIYGETPFSTVELELAAADSAFQAAK